MDLTGYTQLPPWKTRQIILATIFIVAIGVLFWLIIRFRVVLFILFVSIAISTAITPAVDWLYRRGVPRPVGVILIYFLLLGLLAGFAWLAAPLILEQAASIAAAAPGYYQNFRTWMIDSHNYLLQLIGMQLTPRLEISLLPTPSANPRQAIITQVSRVLAYSSLFTHALFVTLAIALLVFYWTLEGERTIRALLLLFPLNKRDGIRQYIDAIQARVGGYISGQALLCAIIGAEQLVAYMIIGLPYALLLGVLAGVLEAVPVIGPSLGAVPAIMVALSANDTSKVIWVLVATVIIHLSENVFIGPRVMGRSVGVNPIVVLLSLAAFSSLFGLPGALMAIPIAAILQLLIDRLVLKPEALETPAPLGRDALSRLRLDVQELSTDVRKQVRIKEVIADGETDQVEDNIEGIANELDKILAQISAQQEPQGEALNRSKPAGPVLPG